MLIKAYLDHNIVSAIAENNMQAEGDALARLLERNDAGEIELATSKVAQIAIVRLKSTRRGQKVTGLYRLLEKVTFINDDHHVLDFYSHWDQFGGVSYPLVDDDYISSTLREIRIDCSGAHHLAVAIRGGCEVFFTFDNGILRRRSEIEGQFQIVTVTPSDFLNELS